MTIEITLRFEQDSPTTTMGFVHFCNRIQSKFWVGNRNRNRPSSPPPPQDPVTYRNQTFSTVYLDRAVAWPQRCYTTLYASPMNVFQHKLAKLKKPVQSIFHRKQTSNYIFLLGKGSSLKTYPFHSFILPVLR